MSKIFILEGPDGAGKSTLANKLAQLTGGRIEHFGPPKMGEDVLNTYAQALFDADRRESATIFDRLYVGERIYGPIYRSYDRLGWEGETLIKRIISGLGVIEVICLPPYETALKNWKDRKASEMFSDEAKYKLLYDVYSKRIDGTQISYDYTKSEPEWPELLTRLVLKRLSFGCIGSTTAQFLFVGDRANHEELDFPFMSTQNSSHFLFESILQAGFQEHEMAFINANTIKMRFTGVDEAWLNLNKPVVICLGNNASQAFHQSTKYQIPHPAYWKRFHASSSVEYIGMLKVIRDSHVRS